MAKEFDPDVVTVAGGHFHSHMAGYTLETFPDVDYVVRYEGEQPFHQLVRALNGDGKVEQVPSLAYRGPDGAAKLTPPAPLADLDRLPPPAYDLMPIRSYSPFGMLWPRAATIQGSRGCTFSCEFCSWNAMENEHVQQPDGHMEVVPHRRQKSVARTLEEIDLLYGKYKVRYLFWADGTWNADNEWLDELCSEIIRRRYKLGWWAFVRADLLLEQEKLGILEKMVRAGFRHTLFGGERPVQSELDSLGKPNLSWEALPAACKLLREKYPEVFRQATFVTGIRSESEASLERLAAYSRACRLDFAAYHPVQPYPGTALWEEAQANGWIEEQNFANFDMFYPVMSTEHLTRAQVASMTAKITRDFVIKQPHRYLAGMTSRHIIRRRLHWWFAFSIGRAMAHDLGQTLRGQKQFEGFSGIHRLWKPRWYDK